MTGQSIGVRRGLCLLGVLLPVLVCGCRAGADRRFEPGQQVMEMDSGELMRYAKCERELTSADPTVRRNAAVALLAMDHPRALEAVLECMKNARDPAVRVSMIEAASFCEDPACFDVILGAVKDPDQSVKQAAASALSRFTGPQEVEAVMDLATDSSTMATEKALLFATLGEGLFVRATPVLLKGLASSEPELREAAWQALKNISGRGFPPESAPWQDWWEANQHKSRENILEERLQALTLELQINTVQNDELKEEFDQLCELLESPVTRSPQQLLADLGSSHRRVRGYAAFRLASLEPEALQAVSLDDRETYGVLHTALKDGDAEVRENAAKLVVMLKGEFRNQLLLEAMSDQDTNMLLAVIEAANEGMGEAALKPLEAALASGEPRVREAAANALGKVGSAQAIGALTGVMQDKEENVRWFAVESLRKLHATAAVPRLCELLGSDESPRVREITASTLGELGQPAAVPALRESLGDENERVVIRTVEALKSLARDDFELMMVIADALAGHSHYDAAEEVLSKIVTDFSGQANLETQLIAARQKRAEILKAQNDFRGAAAAYAELDKLTGGDRETRRQLIECWLAAGDAGQIVDVVQGWLKDGGEGALPAAVDMGCEAVRKLSENNAESVARHLASLLMEAARAANDEELIRKVQELEGEPASPGETGTPTAMRSSVVPA